MSPRLIQMKVAMIGAGYVGCVTAAILPFMASYLLFMLRLNVG
jgi:hypothetical protein